MAQDNNKKYNSKLSQIKDTAVTCGKMLALIWRIDKVLFITQTLAMIIPAAIPFVSAYIFKLLIDLIVAGVAGQPFNYQHFYFLLGLNLATQYLQRLAFSLQDYNTKIFFMKLPISLYQMVLNKMSSLDLQYFEDSNFRDTLQKVRENYAWRPLNFSNDIFFLMQSVTQVLISLYAILKLNMFLALLILFVSIPDFINQIYFSRFAWFIWSDRTPYRKRFEYLSELVQRGESIKELKIFQLAKRFLTEIHTIQNNFFNENKVVLKKQLGVSAGFGFLGTVVLTGVMAFVILQALARKITIGDISFYSQVIGNFNNGIGGLFRNISRIFEDSLYVQSIFDLLDTKSKIPLAQHPVKVDYHTAPLIEFRNVSFAYPTESSAYPTESSAHPGTKRKILNHFSLTVNPGEKVAFVGENGAGKSTMIKLLARFYDVDEGEILINGINLKDLDLESWYKAIGVLFQDFNKYEYPAKDNVYFGKIWEKEELKEIVEAAKSAGAHEMINKFEAGYNQMLGRTFEGGIEPSGGQWQKIALSRGFFRNAPVLILDEPTAAIDAKAESEIFNRVEELSQDKTVIIISHRFSTVRNADKIYVIDEGKIVESGSHDQLIKINGQYATLFNLQAKGYR